MITFDLTPKTVRVQIEVDIRVFPYADADAITIAKQLVKKQLELMSTDDAQITKAWVIEP